MRISLTVARLLAAALLFVPFSAFSAIPLSAEDTIAGLGTEIVTQNSNNDATVTVTLRTPKNAERVFSVPTNGRVQLSGEETRLAGTYDVTLKINGDKQAQTTFYVLPERLDPKTSTIVPDRTTIKPNGHDEVEVAVRLQDRFGNALSKRPVELISNRSEDRISLLTGETNGDGEQRFLVTTREQGSMMLRAIDLVSGELLASNITILAGNTAETLAYGGPTYPFEQQRGNRMFYAQLANGFDIIDRFEISAPAQLSVGVEAQKIVIRAVDRNGKTVEDYVGTVVFSSTDPNASLPAFGTYTFQERDLGVREFPLALKFQTPGEQTFRVEDRTNPNIFHEITVIITGTIGIPEERKIIITSHQNEQTIKAPDIVLEGKGPPFINLIVMGGITDVLSETDAEGKFSVAVALNPEQRDFTIRVRDDRGQHDSGPLHFILDAGAPSIGTIEFSPQEPTEASNVLLVVTSEPGLPDVTMILTRADGSIEELNLLENDSASGSYQLLFSAPKAGAYQPVIHASDNAGNTTEIRTVLTVSLPSLPKVENVRASPKANAVTLEWDAVGTAVDEYRIYVGEDPKDFLYNLDTGRPATKATVSGLLPGRTYFFALTALKGKTESSEKSDVVQARVQGLTLDIREEDSSLLIEWSSLPTDIPLDSFLLEYGTEPGSYTEKRTLHGELRAYNLRDLLNDVTYYLRLTPTTITQDLLEDLMAVGQGTPHTTVTGFRPGPADPVPFDITPGGPRSPIGASTLPRTPGIYPSGIPGSGIWVALGATVLVAGIALKRRKALRQEMAFLKAIQKQYTQR